MSEYTPETLRVMANSMPSPYSPYVDSTFAAIERAALLAHADAWEADRRELAILRDGFADAYGEIEGLRQRIEALEREREDAKRHTYCAWCGADYPLDSPETPTLVAQHIFACEKHPIHEIRKRLLNRVWANCTLGTAEELEAQALLDWIDEHAALAQEEPGADGEGTNKIGPITKSVV